MLMPKRVKFRKQQRGRRCGKATSGDTLVFGSYGLVSLEAVWLNARQIEAARVAISHSMKKGGRMWLRVFPDKPVTKKPAETRMGKGKGAPEYWVCVVKPGRVVLEVDGVTDAEAHSLLRLAGSKLPMRTRIVKRREGFTYEGF